MSHSGPNSSSSESQPARLAVMLSGSGRTLANLLDHIDAGKLYARVTTVISSRQCPGIEIAQRCGLHTTIEPGEISAPRLAELLLAASAQWVVLAGYLRRLAIPPGFANRVVNIHPALLPAFGGPGMYGLKVHQAVIDASLLVSGCTVHLCDDEYDRGQIVLQERCPVLPGDTAQTLADRVFQLELAAYPKALELLFSGRVRVGEGTGPAGSTAKDPRTNQ